MQRVWVASDQLPTTLSEASLVGAKVRASSGPDLRSSSASRSVKVPPAKVEETMAPTHIEKADAHGESLA
jgi:hypothetical protein